MKTQTLTPEQTAQRKDNLKKWNRDLLATIGKIVLVCIVIAVAAWWRVSRETARKEAENSITVTSIDYARHEYTARKNTVNGLIEYRVKCALCPTTPGTYHDAPDSRYIDFADIVEQKLVSGPKQ